MLLPDSIRPELSIYYIGFLILSVLKQSSNISLIDLYQKVKAEGDVSFSSYILGLDWLYLIGAAELNTEGKIDLCI